MYMNGIVDMRVQPKETVRFNGSIRVICSRDDAGGVDEGGIHRYLGTYIHTSISTLGFFSKPTTFNFLTLSSSMIETVEMGG